MKDIIGIPRDSGHVHWCGWCETEIGVYATAAECFKSDREHVSACASAPFAAMANQLAALRNVRDAADQLCTALENGEAKPFTLLFNLRGSLDEARKDGT